MSKKEKVRPNFEILDGAIDWATVQEERNTGLYDQNTLGVELSCGTAHCLAGHIVAEAGYLPYRFETDDGYLPDWGDVFHPSDPKRELLDTWDTAARLAGLEDVMHEDINSGHFFGMFLSLGAIKWHRDRLAAEWDVPARYTGGLLVDEDGATRLYPAGVT